MSESKFKKKLENYLGDKSENSEISVTKKFNYEHGSHSYQVSIPPRFNFKQAQYDAFYRLINRKKTCGL
jgi:hypothetical protein